MNTVKLVDITVKEVPYIGYEEIRYYCMQDLVPFGDGALVCDETIQAKVVPVTRLYKDGKPDVAVAYTEELENVLGIPVRTLLKEREDVENRYKEASRLASNNREWAHKECHDRIMAESRLAAYLSASFFKRLKYLFTGEL